MKTTDVMIQSRALRAREKEKREQSIYADFNAGIKVPGAFNLDVIDMIQKKYGIKSKSTVYAILHRVERRNAGKEESC